MEVEERSAPPAPQHIAVEANVNLVRLRSSVKSIAPEPYSQFRFSIRGLDMESFPGGVLNL